MEVCRAAVGTDCRASESRPSLLSSPLLSSLLLTTLHPSLLFVLSRRPRLQPLALSHRRPTQPLSPRRSSRISPRRDSSRRVSRARKRIAGTRAVSLLRSRPSRSSLSSRGFLPLLRRVIAATGARVTRTHTCTGQDALFPRLFSSAIPRRFHSDPP